jgi:hypothetical protein
VTRHIRSSDPRILARKCCDRVRSVGAYWVVSQRALCSPMSDSFPRGVVLFEPLPNRTTEITIRLRSSIEPVTLAKVTREYLTNSNASWNRNE